MLRAWMGSGCSSLGQQESVTKKGAGSRGGGDSGRNQRNLRPLAQQKTLSQLAALHPFPRKPHSSLYQREDPATQPR